MLRRLLGFIGGIGSSLALSPVPYVKYPFAYPEKAMTFDWENVGEDIAVAIKNDEEGK